MVRMGSAVGAGADQQERLSESAAHSLDSLLFSAGDLSPSGDRPVADGVDLHDIDEAKERERIKNEFAAKQSSGSGKLSDIDGILFGGISSRFWLYRKHMICMDLQVYANAKKKVPFFAWDCITLQKSARDVDLVITNEAQMLLFIKFLIWSKESVNG